MGHRHAIGITFAKTGSMKFISHLDLLRLFGRALRRAEIPFEISCGFNRRPRMTIKRALKLGLESESEEAVFKLAKPIVPLGFKDRLQRELPFEIKINDARSVS